MDAPTDGHGGPVALPAGADETDDGDAADEAGPEAQAAREIAAAAPGQAREAEARLYALLAPRLRRYGLRHLRDTQAAADLVQQVMVLTLERLRKGGLREPGRVVSFVLGASRLTVRNLQRGERRRAALLERHADERPLVGAAAEQQLQARQDHALVSQCLQRLSERERAVIVLSFFGDETAEGVGTQLGLSPGNVRVIRHRSLDKLRRCVVGEAEGAR